MARLGSCRISRLAAERVLYVGRRRRPIAPSSPKVKFFDVEFFVDYFRSFRLRFISDGSRARLDRRRGGRKLAFFRWKMISIGLRVRDRGARVGRMLDRLIENFPENIPRRSIVGRFCSVLDVIGPVRELIFVFRFSA